MVSTPFGKTIILSSMAGIVVTARSNNTIVENVFGVTKRLSECPFGFIERLFIPLKIESR
jgi:hypothetical protein